MEAAKDICGRQLRVLKREESLRSRQHRGVCVRVIYERDSLEVLRTEMEPGSSLDNGEVGNFCVIHFIIEGSPAISAASESSDLMPGDSVILNGDEKHTITNPTFSRATLLSIVFKNEKRK